MKDKIINLLLPFSWFLILLFCIFLFVSFKSSAAVPQQSALPYLVDSNNFVNADGYTLQELQQFYDNRWGGSYPKDFTADDVLIYEYTETINNVSYNFTTVWIPYSSNYTYAITLNDSYNAFDTDINTATIKFIGYSVVSFSTYRNRYNDPSFTLSQSATNVPFFYNSNKEVTYISNPYYYLASSIDGANDYPVFDIARPIYSSSHATPPDFTDEDLNVDDNILTPPTWETPGNPPTFDSSDIPQSIYNIIEWGIADPNGSFHIIKNNLESGFEWLVDVISGYGEAIINNIQNSLKNLYDNFVSLFEPIGDNILGIREKFEYITAPFDSSAINAAFTSTDFYGVKTQFTNTFTIFDNAFDISEPDSFTIIFNVQNITLFYDFGVRSPVTVDLGANFIPIRQALRTFLWVLVSFGSVFVVEHGLANWLRGERNP